MSAGAPEVKGLMRPPFLKGSSPRPSPDHPRRSRSHLPAVSSDISGCPATAMGDPAEKVAEQNRPPLEKPGERLSRPGGTRLPHHFGKLHARTRQNTTLTGGSKPHFCDSGVGMWLILNRKAGFRFSLERRAAFGEASWFSEARTPSARSSTRNGGCRNVSDRSRPSSRRAELEQRLKSAPKPVSFEIRTQRHRSA